MRFGVRLETGDDLEAVWGIHNSAFPTDAEARLSRMLRDDLKSEISLVAERRRLLRRSIIGHIVLSRMEVTGDGRAFRALALAPVAVLPSHQHNGVGSALITEALRRAERSGEELVFVLGEPDYYGRFGFTAEAAAPFASPYAGPFFMAKAFGVPLPKSGVARHAPAFARL